MFIFSEQVPAQDDETRQQSGLPTFIGPRPGTNGLAGTDATLSGSFTIQGLANQESGTTFTIAVLANGSIVARQPVRNNGSYSFGNVPRIAVSLLIEADGLEISNYQIGTLNPPPLANRHDIIISWNQVGRAVKLRNEVITIRNSYKRTDVNQGRLENALGSVRAKKYDAAEKELKKMLADDGNDFVAWTELGSAYFLMEKYGDAESSYGKALALKTDFGPALLNLGKLQIAQKKPDGAIEILSRALAQSPDSADVNHYLGEAYLQAKKGSKAVPLLNRAIELAPTEKTDLHLRLATLYNAANLKGRAAAEYKLFLEKVPNYKNKAEIEKYIKENLPK